MTLTDALVAAGLLAAWLAFVFAGAWVLARLTARRCPVCGSKWRTHLVGEWDGEMWSCRACDHYWESP